MFPIWHGRLLDVGLVDAVAHVVVVVLVASAAVVVDHVVVLSQLFQWLVVKVPRQRLLEKIETDKLEWPFKFFNGD